MIGERFNELISLTVITLNDILDMVKPAPDGKEVTESDLALIGMTFAKLSASYFMMWEEIQQLHGELQDAASAENASGTPGSDEGELPTGPE